jgi:AsmA protein
VLDADVRISTDAVRIGSFDLGRTAATVSVKNSRLLANLADMRVEDGTASGEIGLDYSGAVPRVSVRGKIDRGDASRLSQAFFGVPVASGAATIYADVSATGRSTAEMTAAAQGKMSIALLEGSALNGDLRSLLAAAQQRDVTDWKAARGTTTLPKTDMRLALRQGRIALEQCVIGEGDSRMSSTGYVEPISGRLEMRIQMGPQISPNGKADTLMIDGTLAEPRIRSQVATAARQPTPERASNSHRK